MIHRASETVPWCLSVARVADSGKPEPARLALTLRRLMVVMKPRHPSLILLASLRSEWSTLPTPETSPNCFSLLDTASRSACH
ncbi:hypothetical protein E2C01_042876 [Portunus trituberculatus]|uniref:Uncharacterized protein n=1 Tax=Portunus trituberculatus TaxID=210409 RepID=A0A5B7FRE0_PORTR|nr:hypothetical protein [Portunus trituberculatus]